MQHQPDSVVVNSPDQHTGSPHAKLLNAQVFSNRDLFFLPERMISAATPPRASLRKSGYRSCQLRALQLTLLGLLQILWTMLRTNLNET